MKKSLIAAATFAAIAFGANNMANAGVAGVSLNGISAAAGKSAAEQAAHRKHHWKHHWWHKKKWVCKWRGRPGHKHKYCYWR